MTTKDLPDTPAGRQCAAWLEAFNRGHRAAYAAFLAERFPARTGHLEEELELRDVTGGFFLCRVEESTDDRLVALVQERDSDQLARLTLEVASGEPAVIIRLGLLAVPRPADLELPRLDEAELLAALASRVDGWVAADRFAGAVLVARNGRLLFARAHGFADRARRQENTLETRFCLGSMNKMFTATAVLQLVQAGRLSLDDPVGRHLPDYPNRDVASQVTIRHLLTHTGGTGDFFGPAFDAHRLQLRTLADYVGQFGERGPAFPPGSRHEYSNYGFLLLGLVLEAASGRDYDDYVRDHIYRPAGMTATGQEPQHQPVPGRAVGYTRDQRTGRWRRNSDTLPYRGTPAGGGTSTVGDLLRFATALQSHRLLDARHTELLTTGQVDTPDGRYALGFREKTVAGARCFGHAGRAPGMNGTLAIRPASGHVLAVLANLDPPAADRVLEFILNRV